MSFQLLYKILNEGNDKIANNIIQGLSRLFLIALTWISSILLERCTLRCINLWLVRDWCIWSFWESKHAYPNHDYSSSYNNNVCYWSPVLLPLYVYSNSSMLELSLTLGFSRNTFLCHSLTIVEMKL